MNASCSKSCAWISDHPPGAIIAYTPQENATQIGEDAQFTGSSFCPTPEISNELHPRNRFCNPGDFGRLNIPSIYETMNNDCFDNQNGAWNMPCDVDECPGTEAGKCDVDNAGEHPTNITEAVPSQPLKRIRRQRANDRERRRMKSLNGALNNLKRCIPLPKTKRRVTKLEILRIACDYIQSLWETLKTGGNDGHSASLGVREGNQHNIVNGMSVTQRLSLLSNNLKFNIQL